MPGRDAYLDGLLEALSEFCELPKRQPALSPLQRLGLPVIVVEARHMRSSLSTMRNKTDRNDALGIAQMMRMGWYRAVHIKGQENRRLRTMLANRKLLKRKLVDLENHIRGSLRIHGLRVGSIARGKFEARVREGGVTGTR